jgi:glyoxylase-like metal-dependent hydrolase (beta-lactamase superfamily II)
MTSVNIPTSDQTVKVFAIDKSVIVQVTSIEPYTYREISGTTLDVPAGTFIRPVYKGSERFHYPAYVYLLRHASGKNVLFDLGIRKDWTNLPPHKVKGVEKNGWKITTGDNMSKMMAKHDIKVTAVVWSHPHLDHVGDLTTFSKETTLVVGKNFKTDFMPGYPLDESSGVWDHDFTGRPIQSIEFENSLNIGGFAAHDFFGDGSFYLLDTPGHMKSHVCGLARISSEPSRFAFLGGDIAHHAGQIRPSVYRPLPIPRPQLCQVDSEDDTSGATLESSNDASRVPFYTPSPGVHHDIKALESSLDAVRRFDADDRIMILLAHDVSIRQRLEFFPKDIDKCFDKIAHDEIRWGFIKDFQVV